MQGATFTISSLGGIGGTAFTPIVNAPEVAILGVVRSKMAPVWDGKAFVPRLMLPLCLSYDHRVIDGAAAARFMRHLVRHRRGHAPRPALSGLAGTMDDASDGAAKSGCPTSATSRTCRSSKSTSSPARRVAKEEVLLTLESDKATLDVPAPEAGVIGEIKVKVGDKVSQGALLATFAGGGAAGAAAPSPPSAAAPQPPQPAAGRQRRAAAPAATRPTSNATCWCSAPAPAATPPPSAPPISARRSCWSSGARRSAASASTSAASPPRRCCTSPR